MNKLLTSLLLLLLVSPALSHPGETHHHDLQGDVLKRAFFENAARSYSSCSASISKRDMADKLAIRRADHITSIRSSIAEKRRVVRRQSSSEAPAVPSGTAAEGGGASNVSASVSFDSTGEKLLNTSHASNLTGVTVNSTSSAIFDSPSSDSASCLLQPEATIGPYWVSGEYIREDITEDQQGIPLYINIQVVDVTSCSVVPDIYWEIWHCNASGVYSGVIASGNGNVEDTSNLNATFLRGLQPTDADGVATLKTVFPGHYTGRTTHMHVVAHSNATVYSNGTIGTGAQGDSTSTTQHIGQLFFDQTLLDAVAAVAPYSDNTQTVTTNAEDDILAGEAVEGASDPFFEYVYLTDDIADGIYAWATVGIDSTASYTTQAASYLTPEGGVANANSAMSGGGMGSSGNMTMAGNGTDGTSMVNTTGNASSNDTASGLTSVKSTASSASAVVVAASSSSSATSSACVSRSLPALLVRALIVGKQAAVQLKGLF